MISMNLKSMRKLHRLTQEEVAEKIGVSRQAVAKWENGETVPDIQNCLALAELYDVVLDDLVKSSDQHVKIGIRPKGKHMYGMVKVGDRGQIVIPKKARDIFDIRPGDRLVVLGDEAQGIAIFKLWSAIEKLKGDITIILTTHYMEEAEALSDHIGVMSKGKLRAAGTTAELTAKTSTGSLEDAFVSLATLEEAVG
ncbi:helix-turn-helix domain-containing protein [Paenibacillus ihbetae]|uniref:helix-turn-helix domain-containing protein n=1 Tax=Paenibacillus ihbetae TaxID=1870820 RepID=UPI00142D9410|nr:helix-turn-helix domain-containing protein [Paenibacillus ihbetae]